MQKGKENLKIISFGILIGFINSFLGAGGGMVAVPLLNNLGLDEKKSHANAVAIIFPITVVSAVLYLIKNYVTLQDALPFLPAGIGGAVLGSYLLSKINPNLLKKIFSVVMIYAGIRLLIR